jgi:ferredoxin
MEVWIDQGSCVGTGSCENICDSLFVLGDDGLAYVKAPDDESAFGKDGVPIHQGTAGRVEVPTELEAAAKKAVKECPGECIFFE